MKHLTLLMLLSGCASGGLVTTSATGPGACSASFDPDNVTPLFIEESQAPIALYSERCNGGLYLISRNSGESLLKINESWWLDRLNTAELKPGGKALTLTAQFVTGIGPTGAIPFSVDFRVHQANNGTWHALQLPPDEDQPVELEPGVLEISNKAQLANVGLRTGSGEVTLNPDFSTKRLIIKSLWLTSGSQKVTSIAAHRNDRAYFISYKIKAPRIGTTDMKHVVLYVELPRDHRYPSFEKPEFNSTRINTTSGILENATFNGALPL